ncbi:MAG: ComEC/Rec2 family competence protein [Propionicimonas sp.]|uniref:ComEC/Rec2 family competence protein n=1 Tax=Propionicimonas sp. TaxID=1955623 RepID=UPI003D0E041E
MTRLSEPDAVVTDWRPPLLAAAVWAGAWAGTSGDSGVLAVAVGLGLVTGLVGRRRGRWLVVALGLAVLVVAGLAGVRAWAAANGPVPSLAREGAVVELDARVGSGRTTDSGVGGPVWSSDATLVALSGRGTQWLSGATVRLSASGELARSWAEVPPGSTVRTTARLGPATVDEQVSAWAQARLPPLVVAAPGPLDAAVTGVRAGLRASVAELPPAPRALVPALVVGDTELLDDDLRASFRVVGLTHLTAVSGANLTLLLAAMLWVAARLRVVGWWRRGVAAAGVVGFVLLCRAEPSVLRAAAMGVVGLAALGWGGGRQGLRFLSWAVVGLLLVDPWLCRSVGFVLSVCASAGIILWAARWVRLWWWAPRWLAEAVTVPVAAQLATQPVVTAISGQVSVVGVVANLAAAPLVGPATVLGFAAAALSVPVLPLARLPAWLAGGFAQALVWIAQVGAALPGAAVVWPVGPVGLGVLAACCVVALAAMPLLWSRPWLVALLALVLVLALLRPVAVPSWPPQGWQVVSCDVGQGDASVVAAGGGSAIVVDAGPDPVPVDRCLDQLGISDVAWFVVTHLHADHVGGVAGVAAGRRVDNVLYSGVTQPEGGWQLLVDTLPTVPRTVAAPGMVVAAGDVRLEVLAEKPYVDGGVVGEDSADQNDSSIVMRVTSGGLRVLLGGDVEEAGQSHALGSAADLSAQVLLVPHHGSAHQSPEFLASVHEAVALVSVGAGNDYGHPAARTIATVEATGARVYRTDLHGSIAVTLAGDHLQVTTQRSG